MSDKGIEKLATVKIDKHHELYKVVDMLNRTLKDRDLMFGLALDEDNESEKMVFTIYET
ncbi:YpmA family protein [Bacillus shivajii]|nr:YpmA family protein [Bacillus shivajii]UCZ55288.1 YpmA family protein [Bacillus shivajii]